MTLSFVMLAPQAPPLSPWWIVVTFCALAALIHDWRGGVWQPWQRNLVVGVVLAGVMSVGLQAAVIPNINYCIEWHLTPSDAMYWILSCWAF